MVVVWGDVVVLVVWLNDVGGNVMFYSVMFLLMNMVFVFVGLLFVLSVCGMLLLLGLLFVSMVFMFMLVFSVVCICFMFVLVIVSVWVCRLLLVCICRFFEVSYSFVMLRLSRLSISSIMISSIVFCLV